MTYIYIDESGDLGFSEKSSTYFVISCIVISDDKTNKKYSTIPKKIRQRKLAKKVKKNNELKFSNSSKLIREQFLTRVSKLDLDIYAVIIKKEHTTENLQEELPILYNYLLKILLEKCLNNTSINNNLHICLDRCMSKTQRGNFESYIKTEFFSIFQNIPKVYISHENSQENNALQVTDFVCSSFGYKYNTMKLKEESNIYTNIFQDKIVVEKNDLFKER